MVYLKYVENVVPLSKLIGLLFLFCLPLLSILFLKTKRNDLARPVMGTIFLVGERSEPLSRVFNDQPRGISESAVALSIGESLCRIVRYSSEPNTKVYGMGPHLFKHFFF